MRDLDIYCALCGGPFADRHEGERNVQDRHEYTSESGALPSETWLADSRIIGENPASDLPCKVWLSGPAFYAEYGQMDFERSDASSPETDFIRLYTFEESEDPWSAPFHTRCREVLCRYIGIPVSQLDKEAFFEALKSLARYPSMGSTSLRVNYGAVRGQMGQHWSSNPNMSYFEFDPVQVRGLEDFYTHLPQNTTTSPKEVAQYNVEGDPFAKASSDVLMLIISQLDQIETVFAVRQASPAFASLKLSNRFWKRRLHIDMPWIWDLPALTCQGQIDAIDWWKVYHKLHWGSTPSSPKKNIIRGLCNRKRIWEQMCPVFAKAYQEMKARQWIWSPRRPNSLACSCDNETSQLINPEPMHTKLVISTLLNDLAELPTVAPSVLVDWSYDGYMTGIRIIDGGLSSNRTLPTSPAYRTDAVSIPDGDWLAGFIVTSRWLVADNDTVGRRQIFGLDILFNKRLPIQLGSGEGDKRLIYVQPRRFVVALKMYCSPIDGTLCRIAFIEQEQSAANGCQRVVALKGNGNKPPVDIGWVGPNYFYDMQPTQHMWRRALPPPELRFSTHAVSAGFRTDGDLDPVEFLIFGTLEEELAEIISISANAQLGGFQVNYRDRASRSIGPTLKATKTLAIDGRGGERIIQIRVTENINVTSLRFITNRGRNMSVGNSTLCSNSSHKVVGQALDIYSPSNKSLLCGLYGYWKTKETRQEFRSVSTIRSRAASYSGGIKTSLPSWQFPLRDLPPSIHDCLGLFWEPSPPPPWLKEDGPIWGAYEADASSGQLERTVDKVPSAGCTVTWLDCSPVLSEVQVTLVHSSKRTLHAPISSITFVYADNKEVTAGTDRFPLGLTGGSESGSCLFEEKDDTHQHHQSWQVGNKKLTSLRIWRSHSTILSAIQLIAEGQAESPIWGPWGYDAPQAEATELPLMGSGEEPGRAVGLKLFFQNYERENSNHDTTVVAIQALSSSQGISHSGAKTRLSLLE